MEKFILHSEYKPTGDQPQAIEALVKGFKEGNQCQTLLGVTGSGKTFTMANVIEQLNKPMDADMVRLNSLIRERILYDVDIAQVSINPDNGFIRGGFDNDTGLTGRKISVDTYGGLVPHGGGAFSGKDPSKVDRSAAYMCRFVAKNLVANKIIKECCISVAYDFGEENPAMIDIVSEGKSVSKVTEYVKEKFDFRPNAIIERLNLTKTKYLPTATYGHFTNPLYPWEKIIEL